MKDYFHSLCFKAGKVHDETQGSGKSIHFGLEKISWWRLLTDQK